MALLNEHISFNKKVHGDPDDKPLVNDVDRSIVGRINSTLLNEHQALLIQDLQIERERLYQEIKRLRTVLSIISSTAQITIDESKAKLERA